MLKFPGRLLVVFIAVLVGTMNVHVSAQGNSCTLPKPDCDVLAAADAKLGQLVSFAYGSQFALELTLKNDSGDIVSTGTIGGQGEFEIKNHADLLTAIANLKLSMTLSSLPTIAGKDNKKYPALIPTTQIRVVDGGAYMLSGDAKAAATAKWVEYKLEDLLKPMQALFQTPGLRAALTNLPAIKGFITVEKGQDSSDAKGQKLVGFVYTLDLKTLITSTEFRPILKLWLVSNTQMAGGDTSTLTDDKIAAQADQLSQLLAGSAIKITRDIGADDKETYSWGIHATIKMAPSFVTPDLLVQLDLGLAKSTLPVKVEAPADAATAPMPQNISQKGREG